MATGRFLKIIKYWFKILESKDNKYIKIIYNILTTDLELRPNIKNWVSLLRDLLCSLGFYEVWLFQGVGQKQTFFTIVKQRLRDTFIQNWRMRLNESSRAISYRDIFGNFEYKRYFNIITVENLEKPFRNSD